MIDKNKLEQGIRNTLNGSFMKGNFNMADNEKKVEDARQKAADARPGNVVSQISAFGTPSTYEDPNHEDGKAIAQLDEERTQDVDKFNDDQDSIEKVEEQAAEAEAENAERIAADAQAEAGSNE